MKTGRDLIIFDLDGTLALDYHRASFLRQTPKDWTSYFALCHLDFPNHPLVSTYRALLADGHFVEIWTGRAGEYRAQTEEWIKSHLGPVPDRLRMRPVGDRMDDNELKRSWLAEARSAGDQVVLVFEDRRRVVEMWREEGVLCAQVAEGNF
jgi:phosphoserine phosphatase